MSVIFRLNLETFLEDVRYDPRRGLYYVLGGVAAELTYTYIRFPPPLEGVRTLLFFGGIALIFKGAFFFRRRSEGLQALWRDEGSLLGARTEASPDSTQPAASLVHSKDDVLQPEGSKLEKKAANLLKELALIVLMVYIAGKHIELPPRVSQILFAAVLAFVAVSAIRKSRAAKDDAGATSVDH